MAVVPEMRPAEAALWAGLARALGRNGVTDVPAHLNETDDPHRLWREPGLLFGQTCGYPLVLGLDRAVRLVATPIYDAEGCDGSSYSSAIVVRADNPAGALTDLRGRVCAFNSLDSQSGYNALRLAVARIAERQRFFSRVLETGGHARSLEAVACGRADVAAIDCVGFAAIGRHCPAVRERVRVIGWTDRAPGLPFITSRATDDETLRRLRTGLREAMEDPSLATAREALMLSGVECRSRTDYDAISGMASEAARLGYPELA